MDTVTTFCGHVLAVAGTTALVLLMALVVVLFYKLVLGR